jgi:hypothetical protein
MIEVARELAVLIREHARSAELARQPADEVIDAAVAKGLFLMMSPSCYGGAELDLDTFFEVGLVLGEADASHGWVLDFYVEHVWMLCQFPDAFQKELFADRSSCWHRRCSRRPGGPASCPAATASTDAGSGRQGSSTGSG